MMTREEQLKNLYHQLATLNRTISEREENRYASPSEADTIGKLASAIERMEGDVGVADIIEVLKKLTAFIRKTDLQKVKELMPHPSGLPVDRRLRHGRGMPQPGDHQKQMGVVRTGALLYPFLVGTAPDDMVRKHYRG
jgi:hypothetical protein